MQHEDFIYFNGIDGETGEYRLAPRPADAMQSLLAAFVDDGAPKRTGYGIDADDLTQAGWGVVWREDGNPSRREALRPLLDHRREQAGPLFRELDAYPDESPLEFLERHGVAPGPSDGKGVPYHLLIAATPEEIPFGFQSGLACSHSVGRLDLDDLADDHAYAQRLVAFETAPERSRRHAAFFGVEHRDDPPTWGATEHLTQGLERSMARAHRDWDLSTLLRHAARKDALSRLLNGGAPPSLLFTSSHGVCYGKTSRNQASRQGALVCADYPGRKAWAGRPMTDAQLFAAHDLADATDLSGMISCHFACYSAGTPRFDRYSQDQGVELAERPFVSALAKGLLKRGAMAVIGHVDLTFEESFLWHDAGPQISTFESLLGSIMAGHTMGFAMEYLYSRYTQLASGILADVRRGLRGEVSSQHLKSLQHWAAYEDARNFMLLGDPAARLKL